VPKNCQLFRANFIAVATSDFNHWLYEELRLAILEGRLGLAPGCRASRDFRPVGLSRGTVVSVLRTFASRGVTYPPCWVWYVGESTLEAPPPTRNDLDSAALYSPRHFGIQTPKAFRDLAFTEGIRSVSRGIQHDEFPSEPLGTDCADRARKFRSWLRTEDDGVGYPATARCDCRYFGASRGVRCSSEQIIMLPAYNRRFDLLSRLLLKAGRSGYG